MRVAVDLLGGDHAPSAVAEGVVRALASDEHLSVVLVGPAEHAPTHPRLTVVPAREAVGMDEDPARGLRAKPDASVRVCARLVRDGAADALVSVGSTGAALGAAVLSLARFTTRPALAVVLPTATGPVVLLDAGATTECMSGQLVQHAIVGSAYAQTLGIARPRVGLLNVGTEPGKGDALRKDAFAALQTAPVNFVGNVEGNDVLVGGPAGRADVVVTDGFTGNVVLKAVEAGLRQSGRTDLPVSGILLGLDGLCVVGHGAAGPQEVAGVVAAAAAAHRSGLVDRLRALLAVPVAP